MAELPHTCPEHVALQDTKQEEDTGNPAVSWMPVFGSSYKTVNSDLPRYDRKLQAAPTVTLETPQIARVLHKLSPCDLKNPKRQEI